MIKKKKRENKKGTFILIVITLICIFLGILLLVSEFKKMNKAAVYSDRILKLYLNTNDK